jgi:predicted lipoprotein with Yx(FWY)xxD motif
MRGQSITTVLYKPVYLVSVLILAVLVMSACAPAATPPPAPAAPQEPAAPAEKPAAPAEKPAAPAADEAGLSVASDAKLGKILVGDNGMTLYMYTKDTANQSNCNTACLKKWPPLLTQGSPRLGEGVDPALVGTATLADGSKIVTYNKMPLYYWEKDTKAGDTTGQGVGEVWYVVSPAGEVVGKDVEVGKAPPSSPVTAAEEANLSVASDAKLGKILVGDNGMTLYMYTKDTANQSNCNAACMEKWPPLLTQGSPKLGEGVDPALVGTATLADGSKIVTYNKMPLYYWEKDAKAGDTTGQGVGEVWYVVNPEGLAVTSVVSAAEPAGAPAAPAAEEASLSLATDAKLGNILVGNNGMTLYMFTKDAPDQSNCNADCQKKWLPLLTQGSPKLGEGVDPALVGTATLADGSKIVTYNKMPLYYWVQDTKPGDTTGQGVGEVWFAVSPDGTSLQPQPTPTPKPTLPPPSKKKDNGGGGYGKDY